MGKATLLLVAAVALGSSALLATTQTSAVRADHAAGEVQADVLARELAASAHRLVLTAAVQDGGFRSSLGFSTLDFDGGHVTLDRYSATADSLNLELTAFHSGAAHRIRSAYAWTDADFPGPVWLDAPYVSGALDPGAVVSGGPETRPTYFDRRKFYELRLESLLDFERMEDSLGAGFSAVGGPGGLLEIPPDLAPVIEGYHTPTLDNLYFDALDAINDGDLVLSGPQTLSGALALGSPADPRILHVPGNLTLEAGARVEGFGLLLVEGALDLQEGAELDWDGLVLVRTEDDYLPVRLEGALDLRGALLVDQLGAPPGGHMDLTVMRDHTGVWAEPGGLDQAPDRPWHRHTHKYDMRTGGRTVFFYEGGGPGRFDTGSIHRTRFYDTLDFLGDEEVVLEVTNVENHGMARYELLLDGDPMRAGALRYGFGDFADGEPYRTQPFRASDLETLTLQIRSLRLLSFKPNNEECPDQPVCVGNAYDRREALALRLRRAADDALLYEAAMYWHWKESEAAEDEAEERAWRERIENGEAFGTRLTMGDGTRVVFDLGAIRPIGRRLGFLGTDLIHHGTWTEHWSPGDATMPNPLG